MTKPLVIIMVAAIVVTMTSFSIISKTNAQQPQTRSKFGTIASLQYGKVSYKYPELKVLWILSGIWEFKNINSSSPAFNAALGMVMTNGTAPHIHTITDFKMTGSPTKKGITTTYNGKATVSFTPGFIFRVSFMTNVPISIKLIGPSAMSISIQLRAESTLEIHQYMEYSTACQ